LFPERKEGCHTAIRRHTCFGTLSSCCEQQPVQFGSVQLKFISIFQS
jgi:hypothetical protein